MATEDLGNKLNRIVRDAQGALFRQGELAELSYNAFDLAATSIQNYETEPITLNIPIGWHADDTAMHGTQQYDKEDLVQRYRHLAVQQLPNNGLVQLVTIVEAMFADIIRTIVMRYPQKLGTKRTIKLGEILDCASIEEVHSRAVDSFINEFGYKSPHEMAEQMESFISANLLECPAFHRYIEVKASRDVLIHNGGIANEVYERKAGSHMRVKAGKPLPVDNQYFLRSYESCLQLCEWLEKSLHEKWHSSHFAEQEEAQITMDLDDDAQRSE